MTDGLRYYLLFDQRDLTPLFRDEPYLNWRSHNVRFFADDRNYMWTPGVVDVVAFVRDMVLKQCWQELQEMQ